IGLWFDNGYLVEQQVEPSCAPVGGGEGHTDPTTEKTPVIETDPTTEKNPVTETDPTTEKNPVTEEARHDAALGKAGKSRRT
ncbi:hypothetical protein FG476_01265, partial [Xylella fastidiosa subsp. multiplex]|nr:hypothetical protein [Xylella fastidiosa subsp. multiplex]MRT52333.1 hypothetical protein [Xylella fastidiosa subsp. multiplex]MRU22772.1 hypothetical protein [Xylella fastidiosa subsp. multiplex]MRU25190.1 hypothetical protein [Xylella fastidiosa subsp. multiplex]